MMKHNVWGQLHTPTIVSCKPVLGYGSSQEVGLCRKKEQGGLDLLQPSQSNMPNPILTPVGAS